MKFELKTFNRNISDDDVLADIMSVSKILGKPTFTMPEYQEHGKYHPSLLARRFGSWEGALNAAGLDYNRNKISGEDLIADLRNVASNLSLDTISKEDYSDNGSYSSETIKDRYGSWNNALKAAGMKNSKERNLSEEALMQNIFEIWTRLGTQPTYRQISKPLSRYSTRPYIARYGSWQNALAKFVESANGGNLTFSEPHQGELPDKKAELTVKDTITPKAAAPSANSSKRRTKRDPNWRLRFIVMKRDSFKCAICGRSPASDPTVILHVDHVKAWANGGETELDNLQTLCSVCNIGKSDLE
jgi:hypothetical protein